MTLKKAIELGTISHNQNTILITQDDKKALKLLIEAGKRVDFSRRDPNRPSEPLLPGETEE